MIAVMMRRKRRWREHPMEDTGWSGIMICRRVKSGHTQIKSSCHQNINDDGVVQL
jgi:hypothetical protein